MNPWANMLCEWDKLWEFVIYYKLWGGDESIKDVFCVMSFWT